jgi:hypothetical protein
MDVSQAQQAKQLRDVNTKQRKLVVDLSLDKEPLQSVIRYRTRKELATAMRAKTNVHRPSGDLYEDSKN